MSADVKTPSYDDMAETYARIDRARLACKTLEDNWKEWAKDQPQTRLCEQHQRERGLDMEESCRRSWKHTEFELAYKPCPICIAEAATLRASDWLHQRGVPKNLLHATLENWTPQTNEEREALAKARDYAKRPRGFLVMRGGYGNGKGHLAVGIMRVRECGLFKTGADLLDGLRATYNGRAGVDVVEECKRTKLFVLDDLGISAGGRDEMPMLHSILVHRHCEKLPTIITTNLTEAAFYNVIGERMTDRLNESAFAIVHMTGDSHRADVKEEYLA